MHFSPNVRSLQVIREKLKKSYFHAILSNASEYYNTGLTICVISFKTLAQNVFASKPNDPMAKNRRCKYRIQKFGIWRSPTQRRE